MARVEDTDTAAAARPEPAAARRARARNQYNRAMRVVRRAHLYAGLFMVPWVFLYGVTALLFNHPAFFPDQEVRAIAPADVAGTPLDDFPAPRELAGRVVEAINAVGEEGGPGGVYRLVRPEEAAFAREYSTTLTDGKREHSIRIDLVTRSGTVRTAPKRAERAAEAAPPFAVRGGLRLDPPPLEAVTRAMPQVLSRIGLPAEGLTTVPGPEGGPRAGVGGPPAARGGPDSRTGARGRGPAESPNGGPGSLPGGPTGQAAPRGRPGGPELSFLMEGRGKIWRVGYNLQTGAVTGRPADRPPGEPLSTRRFLTRLHMAHGYPTQLNARWFWAVAVDLMFVSMTGWGLTGLLMWWQMKNVRTVGAIVLALGIMASIAAAIGMHGIIAGGP